MAKRGPKGNRKEREKRLTRMAERYMQGASLVTLGQEFGVHTSQAGYDIADIRQQMRERRMDCIAERADREATALDLLEADCRDSFVQSKADDDPGDAAFIDKILKCIEMRCKIYGLFAPDRLQVASNAGQSFLAMPNLVEEIRQRLLSIRPNVIEANGHNGSVHTGNGTMDAGPTANGNGHRPDVRPDAE